MFSFYKGFFKSEKLRRSLSTPNIIHRCKINNLSTLPDQQQTRGFNGSTFKLNTCDVDESKFMKKLMANYLNKKNSSCGRSNDKTSMNQSFIGEFLNSTTNSNMSLHETAHFSTSDNKYFEKLFYIYNCFKVNIVSSLVTIVVHSNKLK